MRVSPRRPGRHKFLAKLCSVASMDRREGGHKDGKLGNGMTFTKATPNFLAKMANAVADDAGGIEGALRRRAERAENSDREDGEDEAPIVVDAAEALTSKERRKLEAAPGSSKGGSLRFKGEDKSAASKFKESAHDHVMERARAEEEAARQREAEEAAGGRVVFSAGGASKRDSAGSSKKKRSLTNAATMGAPKAKAVKNTKLLSFDQDD